MQVTIVWAIREQPDDEDTDLCEFGLFYFRLIESSSPPEESATSAVWVRFSDSSQIETLQFHCPDARLGPSHAFTEGLVLTKDKDEAEALCKKLNQVFMDAEMKEILDEDVMEDY
jgi:hypothetical protein